MISFGWEKLRSTTTDRQCLRILRARMKKAVRWTTYPYLYFIVCKTPTVCATTDEDYAIWFHLLYVLPLLLDTTSGHDNRPKNSVRMYAQYIYCYSLNIHTYIRTLFQVNCNQRQSNFKHYSSCTQVRSSESCQRVQHIHTYIDI